MILKYKICCLRNAQLEVIDCMVKLRVEVRNFVKMVRFEVHGCRKNELSGGLEKSIAG